MTDTPNIKVALVLESQLGIKPIATAYPADKLNVAVSYLQTALKQNSGWLVDTWAGGPIYIPAAYVKKIVLITLASVSDAVQEPDENGRVGGIPIKQVLAAPNEGIVTPSPDDKKILLPPGGTFRPNLTDPNTDPNAPTVG
jgi:hypothetical protein